jgi:glycine/D-amino acid oxidase-like deaminating enzyme
MRAGGGETGRTTAHLVTALDDRYYELERLHGKEATRLAAHSHGAAISRIEEVCAEESIDGEFRRAHGYLFAPPEADAAELHRELECVHRAGLVEVTRVDRPPLPGYDLGAALRFPRQGEIHPVKSST